MYIEDKIVLAIDICNKYLNALKFDRIYPFTNENIAAYLPYFNLEGKSLLTLGSSGDQAINGILYGCKDISVIDICPFTKEYYYLKKSAIKSLTRKEYLNFFCYKHYYANIIPNIIAFNNTLYQKIKETLKQEDLESYYFWNTLFEMINHGKIRKRLFKNDEYSVKTISNINHYLINDTNYNLLKNKIDTANINFVESDIFNYNIKNTYDNIFLSNLSTYYKTIKIKELVDKLLPSLNDNGQILIAYLYNMEEIIYQKGDPDIYNLSETFKIFPDGVAYYTFRSGTSYMINDAGLQDSIITYKKVKKK